MIRRLLRALGVDDARPQPIAVRVSYSEAEARYDRARQQAETVISRADAETERSRQNVKLSWEVLFDDPRRNR